MIALSNANINDETPQIKQTDIAILETTHVVLADHFLGQPTPHWLDEGTAMLADTHQKQLLHRRDCQHAIASQTALPLTQLLTLEQFTSVEQMPAFYGQSLTLIQELR